MLLTFTLGRRQTVFVVSVVFVVGALITASAPNLPVLYFGRFIIGIGVAISAIVDVTYLTEISPIEYRGSGEPSLYLYSLNHVLMR
jgi:MFS transporter, SP family, major inositol transporter